MQINHSLTFDVKGSVLHPLLFAITMELLKSFTWELPYVDDLVQLQAK